MFNFHTVIMAGGEGRRCLPYTKVLPKCLLPLHNGETLLSRLLGQLASTHRRVVTCRAYAPCRILRDLLDYDHISMMQEDEPLGTAGILPTVAKAWLQLEFGNLFVINADVWLEPAALTYLSECIMTDKQEEVVVYSEGRHIEVPGGLVIRPLPGQQMPCDPQISERGTLAYEMVSGLYQFNEEAVAHLATLPEGVPCAMPDLLKRFPTSIWRLPQGSVKHFETAADFGL